VSAPSLTAGAEDSHPTSAPAAPAAIDRKAYWRTNVKVLGVLLVLWFAVSFGAGILFHEELDAVNLPGTGFPLGFWFAQQGAIFVFVAIIWVYAAVMNRLDRRFGVYED
tara:strand:+ start:862 stop:1188 length:327 start_codon:yes stop_codon:yes gene_type:complete